MGKKNLFESELLRYVLVGGGAVCLDFLIYYILTTRQIVEAPLAKRISFIAGALWSYLANKYFTFKKKEITLQEPFLFFLVYLIGFFLNTIIHDWAFKMTSISIAAFLPATIVSVLWNFIGQKYIVFRNKQHKTK